MFYYVFLMSVPCGETRRARIHPMTWCPHTFSSTERRLREIESGLRVTKCRLLIGVLRHSCALPQSPSSVGRRRGWWPNAISIARLIRRHSRFNLAEIGDQTSAAKMHRGSGARARDSGKRTSCPPSMRSPCRSRLRESSGSLELEGLGAARHVFCKKRTISR